MFNQILHVLLHALKESAITFPILFVCYMLIELLEEKMLNKYQSSKVLRSRFSPVLSAGIGLIPQCGFSVVASDFYSKRIITIGTLFAIFIATSDEALPMMLSHPEQYLNLVIILLVKFAYAVVVGLVLDAIFTKKNKQDYEHFAEIRKNSSSVLHSHNHAKHHEHEKESYNSSEKANLNTNAHLNINKNNEIVLDVKDENKTEQLNNKNNLNNRTKQDANNANEEIIVLNDENIKGCCHHKLEHQPNKLKEIFIHPLKHSLIIFAYILLINFVFGLIVEFVGEDAIKNFLSQTGFFEPFIATLIGLIPNCAASVIITETFIKGAITMGSCIAGLCANSGLAIVMLFKMNKNVKENVIILCSLYLLSCTLGIIINLFYLI